MKYIKLFESFVDLETKLLSLGGNRVVHVLEEDLERLIKDGQLYSPDEYDIETVWMENSRCHRNSATFYENFINKNSPDEIELVTGWALYEGVWVQHSWLVLTYDGILIETTSIKRDSYYGFSLSNSEIDDFLFYNN